MNPEDTASVLGTFTDVKTVRSRGVLQIVVEVPIEAGKRVIDVFGFPQPGAEIPVVVFRPNLEEGKPELAKPPEKKERTPFSDLRRCQQAGMLCQHKAFQRYLSEQFGKLWEANSVQDPSENAARVVRQLFSIDSRKELDKDVHAETWRQFCATYNNWLNTPF